MKKIKVLIVEDSLMFRQILVRNFITDPMLEVVAQASDPYEARDAILKYEPDVMTLDIELPRMDGIEFLRKLMPQYPLPTPVRTADRSLPGAGFLPALTRAVRNLTVYMPLPGLPVPACLYLQGHPLQFHQKKSCFFHLHLRFPPVQP